MLSNVTDVYALMTVMGGKSDRMVMQASRTQETHQLAPHKAKGRPINSFPLSPLPRSSRAADEAITVRFAATDLGERVG